MRAKFFAKRIFEGVLLQWSSKKENMTWNKTSPQEEVLKYFCVKQHGVIFITFLQPFWIIPKPDMLQISFFGKDIPVIMPNKKDKFYICILLITNRYNTLKSHKKDAHTGLIILILKRQENSPGCHANLFIFRLT